MPKTVKEWRAFALFDRSGDPFTERVSGPQDTAECPDHEEIVVFPFRNDAERTAADLKANGQHVFVLPVRIRKETA